VLVIIYYGWVKDQHTGGNCLLYLKTNDSNWPRFQLLIISTRYVNVKLKNVINVVNDYWYGIKVKSFH